MNDENIIFNVKNENSSIKLVRLQLTVNLWFYLLLAQKDEDYRL